MGHHYGDDPVRVNVDALCYFALLFFCLVCDSCLPISSLTMSTLGGFVIVSLNGIMVQTHWCESLQTLYVIQTLPKVELPCCDQNMFSWFLIKIWTQESAWFNSFIPFTSWDISFGCFGSTAVLTIGVASKFSGITGEQDDRLHKIEDFRRKY